MKEVEIKLFELTKEETCKLDNQQVLVYNTLTGNCLIEWSDQKSFIGKSKHASEYLKYFTFEDPKFKPGEKDNANNN